MMTRCSTSRECLARPFEYVNHSFPLHQIGLLAFQPVWMSEVLPKGRNMTPRYCVNGEVKVLVRKSLRLEVSEGCLRKAEKGGSA